MTPILHAIVPVFAIIAFGYAMQRRAFVSEAFWQGAHRLTYYLLLPILFFTSIIKADMAQLGALWPLLAMASIATIIITALLFLARALLPVPVLQSGASFSACHQASIRFNNYIGIPIVLSLYRHDGLAVYALLIALAIPLTNIVTIIVMTRYSLGQTLRVLPLIKSVITNPLVIGSVAGVLVNALGIPLGVVGDTLHLLAPAAVTLGLLTVGAGLDLATLHTRPKPLLGVCLLKLVVHPAIMLGVGFALGVPPALLGVGIVYASLPSAASSYIIAKQFNADAPLTAALIVATTLAAFITMPLWLLIVEGL